jgi:hypothetical protein
MFGRGSGPVARNHPSDRSLVSRSPPQDVWPMMNSIEIILPTTVDAMTIERNFFSPSLYYYYYLFWERGQSKDVCRVDAFSQHLNDSSQSQRSKQHKQPGGPREHQTTRKLAHSAVG